MREKKFNGGQGAILCNKCRVIVKEGWGDLPYQISKEDWESNEPIYCKKCQQQSSPGSSTEESGDL